MLPFDGKERYSVVEQELSAHRLYGDTEIRAVVDVPVKIKVYAVDNMVQFVHHFSGCGEDNLFSRLGCLFAFRYRSCEGSERCNTVCLGVQQGPTAITMCNETSVFLCDTEISKEAHCSHFAVPHGHFYLI